MTEWRDHVYGLNFSVYFLFPSCTLKFVVLDYDKFSRSEFVAEVMLSLLEVDLVEGTTLSRHLNNKTISDVSTVSCRLFASSSVTEYFYCTRVFLFVSKTMLKFQQKSLHKIRCFNLTLPIM